MSGVPRTARSRRRRLRAGLIAGGVVVASVAAAAGIALATTAGTTTAGDPPAGYPRGELSYAQPVTGPGLDLGPGGLVPYDQYPAQVWVRNNPNDPRTPVIRDRIAARPSAVWLTGYGDGGHLDRTLAQARAANGTATLCIYNIPGRNDGFGTNNVTLADYTAFIDAIVARVGTTRTVVALEPDALWFVDRQTPPGTSRYIDRMAALNYAVDTFAAKAPNSHVYIEAGTSSGSVTPQRMAQLLVAAGVKKAAGFAVNVSSFSPDSAITAWAQAIRTNLDAQGAPGTHYVVDTSRNGNPSWTAPYPWCNPPDRRLGSAPGAVNRSDGLDANLWIKQPGTSDGPCGVSPNTPGGQFDPQAAYDQAR